MGTGAKIAAFATGLGLLALARKGEMYPPKAQASDWAGWVWPVPVVNGRIPTITQEYKPGLRKVRGVHLGVDIMFPKKPGDPLMKVKHLASPNFIAPEGTPIIAAGPGVIWSLAKTGYGLSILIDHGSVGQAGGVTTFYQHLATYDRSWKKGDRVLPGDILGTMGYTVDTKNDSEQLRHLHFELNFPRVTVLPQNWPQDPAPYMRYWRKIVLPEGLA